MKTQLFLSYVKADINLMKQIRNVLDKFIKETYLADSAKADTADSAKADTVDSAKADTVDSAKADRSFYIWSADKDCAGDWADGENGWVQNLNDSRLLVSIITKNSTDEKRMIDEARIARDLGCEKINVVPIVVDLDKMSNVFDGHLGSYSTVFAETDKYGDLDASYEESFLRKVKTLLDGILADKPVMQIVPITIEGGGIGFNQNFVGRERELEEMAEAFKTTNTVILSGVGGIGKTELAKKYVEKQNKDFAINEYYLVVASDNIIDTICQISFKKNGIPFDEKDVEKRYRKTISMLQELDEKFIFIIDNFDENIADADFSDINEKMKCKFIITSRERNENVKVVDVGAMTDDDLLAIAYKNNPDLKRENKEKLIELFASVDRHTMAIDIMTKIMNDGDISIAEMNGKMFDCKQRCNAKTGSRLSLMEHLSALFAFANLNDVHKKILSAMSLVCKVGINRKDFKNILCLNDTNEIMDLVNRFGLLKIDRMETGEYILSLHGLISDLVFIKLAPKSAENEGILDWIYAKIKEKTYSSTAMQERIMFASHICDKRAKIFGEKEKGELANFQDLYAKVLSDYGNIALALEYSKKAMKIYEALYKDNPQHPDLAMSYNNISTYYSALGEYAKALEYSIKAMEIRETLYKDNPLHPDLASSYNNISTYYSALGEYAKALEYSKKAMEISEALYKDNPLHPSLATSYNNISIYYSHLGYNAKALEYSKKAMKIYEALYKDNPLHPYLAKSYNNVGIDYFNLGDNAKALEYCKKAMEISEALYKDNPLHPDLANSYNNVGNRYSNLGEYAKALEYSKKAMEIYEALYKDNPLHPDLAGSYSNVGDSYSNLGEYAKALEYSKRAMEIRETLYKDNPQHPDLAMSYYNISIHYSNLGDNAKALEYSKKAMEIRETLYKDNPLHPDLTMSYNNMGVYYGRLGEYAKALEYSKRAMEIRETLYKDNPLHPDLAMSYNNVGSFYSDLGDNAKALEYGKKAMDIYEALYKDNPQHPDLAMSYYNVGFYYYNSGDMENAERYRKLYNNITQKGDAN